MHNQDSDALDDAGGGAAAAGTVSCPTSAAPITAPAMAASFVNWNVLGQIHIDGLKAIQWI